MIVEISSRTAYYAFAKRLRGLGFREDHELICRWTYDDDVMPTDATILGFSNEWYRDAMKHARDYALDRNLIVRLVTPPYFCATKIVAFRGRGEADYTASHLETREFVDSLFRASAGGQGEPGAPAIAPDSPARNCGAEVNQSGGRAAALRN